MAKKDKSKDEDKKKVKGKSAEQTEKKKDKKGKSKDAPDYAPRDVKKGEWDEQTGGGATFYKLPNGETECLIRIRSLISVGQCVFEFNGKRDTRATSGIGVVLECWPFKEKKGGLKITSKEPAIVYHTFKALKGNKDSHWSAMQKELKADSPSDLQDVVGLGTVFTSDKGYMYLRKRVFKAGLAEKKACPKLTKKGCVVPNLNEMTNDALKELHPLKQVCDYITKAVNYKGSRAEELINKIRKDKPDFAVYKETKGDAGKASSSKKGEKKKKMDEDKEY